MATKREKRDVYMFQRGRLTQVGIALDGLTSSLDFVSPSVVKAIQAAKHEVNKALAKKETGGTDGN